MEKSKTKLMIEDNTIYEIDLECVRRKEGKQSAKRVRDMKQQKYGSRKKQGV